MKPNISIYDELKRMIMDFEIMPGARITESELATYFNVSRTPIRSVLQRLESEGQLTVKPKQGCFIRTLDIVKISHFYDVRVALENMAIDEVMKQRDKSAIEELAESWDPKRMLFGSDITEELKAAEEQFHITLAKASRNQVLVHYLEDINTNIRAVRRLGWPDAKSVENTYIEHYLICSLMLERKPKQAREEMTNHIRKSQDCANRITLHQIYSQKRTFAFQ